jgi:hypothetical protein
MAKQTISTILIGIVSTKPPHERRKLTHAAPNSASGWSYHDTDFTAMLASITIPTHALTRTVKSGLTEPLRH